MIDGDSRRRGGAKSTVAAGFAKALMDLVILKGASRALLAERSNIDLLVLDDQDARIPFSVYVDLMRAGQTLSGDAALALHFGEAFGIADLSIFGLIGAASVTMADALLQVNRYGRLVVEVSGATSGDRFVVSRPAGQSCLIDTRACPNDFPELTESTFARMLCQARRAPGGNQTIQAVHVTHRAPAYSAEYDRLFQVPVIFTSDMNALMMADGKWLSQATPRPSRYVFGVLSKRADALLKALDVDETMRGKVEALLLPILHTGDVGMERIASTMGISRQTLFRRLRTEGATFGGVLEELRRQLAISYLGGEKVSVNEAAYLVGFSEAAAFSRAFKRWTGASPRLWRTQTSPSH